MANLITLFRFFLLFVIFGMVEWGGMRGHIWAVPSTLFLIALDGIDGIVARRRGESSEFGGVFDIVVDRIVENCFWIFFSVRGVIPVWVPLVVISRGFFTDGIRSAALSKGMTAFGKTSMQKSSLGRAIVSSRASRGLYGFSKVVAFMLLIAIDSLGLEEAGELIGPGGQDLIVSSGYAVIYFTVAFCLIRGLPVVIESRNLMAPAGKG